jgi:hypothetical protein
MANMSYVRFTNTARDLKDCFDNMDDDELSESEEKARKRLIRLCVLIADNYGDELDQQ